MQPQCMYYIKVRDMQVRTRPNLRKNSVHDECYTSHVTTGLKECKECKQYKHLRYETENSSHTGYNTIKDQSL